MASISKLKKTIMMAIIISYVAVFLNEEGLLRYPLGASGTVTDIGNIVGLVFAVIAIRLVLMVPETQSA